MPTNLCKPGTLVPFTFGSSGRGWHNMSNWLLCPKEGQLRIVRQVRSVLPGTKDALNMGILIHACRAQWLNDGRKGELWRKALALICIELRKQGAAISPKMEREAQDIFGVYVSFWRMRPAPTTLAVEYDLGARGVAPNTPAWAYRTARLDSIELHQGKAWIGELKTTSSSSGRVESMYQLHGQLLMQLSLWSDIETKLFGPLGGILLDVIKKPDDTHQPKAYPRVAIPLETLKFALEWFKRDLVTWQMQVGLVDWNATVERRPNCVRPFGACEFRDLCTSGPGAGKKYEVVQADGTAVKLEKWQPTRGQEVPPWM